MPMRLALIVVEIHPDAVKKIEIAHVQLLKNALNNNA